MFDAASRSETASLQPRARGSIAIAVKHDGTRSRLDRLRHQGSAKCLLPRGSEVPEGVIVNTAGGVTGGDRFAWSAETGTEAALTLTTQAAERVYRAQPGEIGQMTTRLTLGAPGEPVAAGHPAGGVDDDRLGHLGPARQQALGRALVAQAVEAGTGAIVLHGDGDGPAGAGLQRGSLRPRGGVEHHPRPSRPGCWR
ncbi:MAG: urease accessory protein UreD, partial [Pseudomonadota bacterium]